MTIIIDTLSFCHYPGFWGYLLGLFQYIPTGLVVGIFFWCIAFRDAFFLCVAITMKVVWFGGLILKYFVIPYLIPNSVVIVPSTCDSYVPTFINYFSSIFFGGDTNSMVQGSEFPNLDVLTTGTYLGFILSFYFFWEYPLRLTPSIGLITLTLVPWSFLSTGSAAFWSILASTYIGIIFGAFGLFVSYYTYYSCFYDDEINGKNKRKKNLFEANCFYFWCGDSQRISLFFYKTK